MSNSTSFKVLFYAQRGKLNRRGRAPIICRITINGNHSSITTHCDVDLERWSGPGSRTPGITKDDRLVNATINDLRALILNKYNEMLRRGDVITSQKLKNALMSNDERAMGLLELCDIFNADYGKQVGRTTSHKTYTRYLLTREVLSEFLSTKFRKGDIPIADINIKLIRDFETYIFSKNDYSQNYVMKFIQRFRTIYNFAKNNGWVTTDPFAFYKFHFENIDRGYLNNSELQTIINYKFAAPALEFIKDMFIFSCYTGLAYIDLHNLTKDCIIDDNDGNLWMTTARQKTGVPVRVRLFDTPMQIINRYRDKSTSDKVFDIPTNQRVNSYLKEIGAICGISKRITFHLARHTFATTITLSNGVPIETVSKLLGHTSIRTTQIYARITDQKISRDMDMLAAKLNSVPQPAAH